MTHCTFQSFFRPFTGLIIGTVVFLSFIVSCKEISRSSVRGSSQGKYEQPDPSGAQDRPDNSCETQADIDIFGQEFPPERFRRKISFSFDNKTMPAIIRHINTLTEIDMAISPPVLEEIRRSETTYSLWGENLPFYSFLNWSCRIMKCSYIESGAPDIWFVYENEWIKRAQVIWSGYPLKLFNDKKAGIKAGIIDELQKGLSWQRPDIRTVIDMKKQTVFVNSTPRGHYRLSRLTGILSDRKFIPFERIKIPPLVKPDEILSNMVQTPAEHESVHLLIRKLCVQAGFSLGYNSSLCETDNPVLSLPLKEYTVRKVLDILENTGGYRTVRFETSRSGWLLHEDEDRYRRNEGVLWENMDVYVMNISSVTKFNRGGRIVSVLKKNVFPRSWLNPGTFCKYYSNYDIIIVVNTRMVVEEVLRFLHSVKKFGTLQTN